VSGDRQLSLFDAGEPPRPSAEPPPPWEEPALRALGARLPAEIRCGTSSWSFPGWRGIVYTRDAPTQALAREGLREYARHPLLRTVGVDRTYYAPVAESDLRRYAEQLPTGFPCCFKAPASVTSRLVPDSARAGRPALNPSFLSAERLVEELIGPCLRAFRANTGVVVLECPPQPPDFRLDPTEFVERLDRCLEALPTEVAYAVELRDRRLLTPAYAAVLARHRVAHTYNYWSAMPMPAAQTGIVPTSTAPFLLLRLLLPPGTRYEAQREAYRPFDRLVDPDPAMRGEVVGLLRAAVAARQPAFLLVNNKAEGSAPLTIRAIIERLLATDPPAA
jgi:uncharacterized protein YecE (DUF72 family)